MTNPLTRSESTPQRILDAAYTLFSTQGFAGTSMRQIAQASGLVLGSTYNHFPSKKDIFLAILQTQHPLINLLPKFSEIEADSMQEFIGLCASELVTELNQKPEFINLLLIEMIEFKGEHASALVEKLTPELLVLNQKLQKYSDHIRPVPPFLLMRVFLGMMISFAMTEKFLKNVTPVDVREKSLETFIEIFLNGIIEPKQ